jgi:hypothetical protein
MTPIDPNTLIVAPGLPRTKLNDEALRLLGQKPEQFDRVHSLSAKRYFPVTGVTAQEHAAGPGLDVGASKWPRPLDQIFILQDADVNEISTVRGVDALMGLVANVYFVEQLAPSYSTVVTQRAAAVIQAGVQVKVLRRKKEPGQLAETAELIEREIFKDALPVLQ